VVVPWFGNRTGGRSAGDAESDGAVEALHAREDLLDRATAREDVSVARTDDGGYVVAPANRSGDGPRVGLVFYAGGRVHPDAYVPSLAAVAAEPNVTVYLPTFPGNLAVLDQDRADDVVDAHPEIDRWYVGGHSLGGSMACRYANDNPDRVEGLLLFASYCDRDVSDTDLDVLSVTGAEDAVLNREEYEASRSNLPDDAVHVELEGVNHSGFGGYVGQPDGEPSGTTFETAHDRLASAVVPWLSNRTAAAPATPVSDRPRAIGLVEPRRPGTPSFAGVRPVPEGF